MNQQDKSQVDAKLKAEMEQQHREALEILGAGDKESLKDVATRRMWQAMPDLMRLRKDGNTAR